MSEQKYIPPAGAMQFELLPKYAEISGVAWLWVTTPTALDRPCIAGHRNGWSVLNPPEKAVEHAKKILGNLGNIPIVCSCAGRIIE